MCPLLRLAPYQPTAAPPPPLPRLGRMDDEALRELVARALAEHVAALDGTGARVLDTRKTTPGLRALEKAAVAAGGGTNHRVGLYDAVLIKENHAALGGGPGEAVRRARELAPTLPIEVECRDLDEVREALSPGA